MPVELLARAQGFLGLALMLGLAWALSADRKNPPRLRWILGAVGLQFALALVLLRIHVVQDVLRLANVAVDQLEIAARAGSIYMFGYLGGGDAPYVLQEGAARPVIIAFEILPLVIVMSAVFAVLWHWGLLKAVVRGLSWALRRSLGVGGAIGLSGGANVFLGVVEAPLAIRAYLISMNRAELFAAMTLSMSTVSGVVLVLYSRALGAVVADPASQLVTASLISLPAALLIAKVMEPGAYETGAKDDDAALTFSNTLEALIKGTVDGVQLVLAIVGVLIVIFALVALADQALAAGPNFAGEALSVKRIFGWAFAPLMWAIGVPIEEAATAGALMGTKAVLNEYVAYLAMAELPEGALSPRSAMITVYALCGFANFASIGLLVSTIGGLVPERRAEAAALGFKSWIAGNLATLMTGAVVGTVA